MKIIVSFVLLISLCSTYSYADSNEYFKAAGSLSSRSSLIGKTIGVFVNRAPSDMSIEEQSEFRYLLSVGETASMCALLNGNIVGAAGMMDENTRKNYTKMVRLSIQECKNFIDFRKSDLEVLSKSKNANILQSLASELLVHLLALEKELTFET
ncbi:hypothetical protein [Pseudoalteromonas sp. SR41-4]|uniref:hypothetical protein n=1 Tax=Pseudoalteromonas sp. SR41-4 TaxID=2760950 RepID=UPI001601E3C0|nr:hypothetical protein [Pseudoalteromonas sp. SR41-4]MBB1295675.1 hypothetical protein [Pseudoalteromonas sp. SR41-4]